MFEMYGAPGSRGPAHPGKIDYCGYPDQIGTPSASDVLPDMVFNRSDEVLQVEIAPSP